MSKLQLPTVTLMIIDCLNAGRAIRVLERCKNLCDFGAVKLLTSIPIEYSERDYSYVKIMPLNTLVAYSIFMLTKVHEYIDTDHVLIVQRDGWILNTSAWEESWLGLDYIGPLFVQYDKVGSGGFSLRSKHIMQEIAKTLPAWDGTQEQAEEIQNEIGYYEDGVICLSDFAKRFRIASPYEASLFAQGGNRNPKYYHPYPFGFHGVLSNINHDTGFVAPVCEHENNPLCGCSVEHINFLQKNETV